MQTPDSHQQEPKAIMTNTERGVWALQSLLEDQGESPLMQMLAMLGGMAAAIQILDSKLDALTSAVSATRAPTAH